MDRFAENLLIPQCPRVIVSRNFVYLYAHISICHCYLRNWTNSLIFGNCQTCGRSNVHGSGQSVRKFHSDLN